MKLKSAISKVVILLALFFAVFVAVFFFLDRDKGELLIEPSELNLEMNNSAQLEAFLYYFDSDEKVNVTAEAEWSTSDPAIATVGNESMKGQLIARDFGDEVEITAKLGEKTAVASIQTARAEMAVECEAKIMKADGRVAFEDTAEVGETIYWMGTYRKLGAPNYDYKWTGTDGLDDDRAIAEMIYETPGVKNVHFWTEDTAGTIAEADCSITIFDSR